MKNYNNCSFCIGWTLFKYNCLGKSPCHKKLLGMDPSHKKLPGVDTSHKKLPGVVSILGVDPLLEKSEHTVNYYHTLRKKLPIPTKACSKKIYFYNTCISICKAFKNFNLHTLWHLYQKICQEDILACIAADELTQLKWHSS